MSARATYKHSLSYTDAPKYPNRVGLVYAELATDGVLDPVKAAAWARTASAGVHVLDIEHDPERGIVLDCTTNINAEDRPTPAQVTAWCQEVLSPVLRAVHAANPRVMLIPKTLYVTEYVHGASGDAGVIAAAQASIRAQHDAVNELDTIRPYLYYIPFTLVLQQTGGLTVTEAARLVDNNIEELKVTAGVKPIMAIVAPEYQAQPASSPLMPVSSFNELMDRSNYRGAELIVVCGGIVENDEGGGFSARTTTSWIGPIASVDGYRESIDARLQPVASASTKFVFNVELSYGGKDLVNAEKTISNNGRGKAAYDVDKQTGDSYLAYDGTAGKWPLYSAGLEGDGPASGYPATSRSRGLVELLEHPGGIDAWVAFEAADLDQWLAENFPTEAERTRRMYFCMNRETWGPYCFSWEPHYQYWVAYCASEFGDTEPQAKARFVSTLAEYMTKLFAMMRAPTRMPNILIGLYGTWPIYPGYLKVPSVGEDPENADTNTGRTRSAECTYQSEVLLQPVFSLLDVFVCSAYCMDMAAVPNSIDQGSFNDGEGFHRWSLEFHAVSAKFCCDLGALYGIPTEFWVYGQYGFTGGTPPNALAAWQNYGPVQGTTPRSDYNSQPLTEISVRIPIDCALAYGASAVRQWGVISPEDPISEPFTDASLAGLRRMNAAISRAREISARAPSNARVPFPTLSN